MKICDRRKCVGCGVCELVCPRKAIQMLPNQEGFLYPEINATVCVKCGKCKIVCPADKDGAGGGRSEYFGVVARDVEELRTSTSGGVASVLSRVMIRGGGIVVGAAYDPFPIVKHIVVKSESELGRLKGSKYVESDIRDALQLVRDMLSSGRSVLFIGLPCHVAAVKSYVGALAEKLITIDLICHGKPSQKLFSHWITQVEGLLHQKIVHYFFRNKRCAWNDPETHVNVYQCEDGTSGTISIHENWYERYFLGSSSFRLSCYRCPFAKLPRVADITIGDFWGAWKDPRFESFVRDGISLVGINSPKGRDLFMKSECLLKAIPVSGAFACAANRQLTHASKMPIYRKFIFLFVYKPYWARQLMDKLLFGSGRMARRVCGVFRGRKRRCG